MTDIYQFQVGELVVMKIVSSWVYFLSNWRFSHEAVSFDVVLFDGWTDWTDWTEQIQCVFDIGNKYESVTLMVIMTW